MVWVRLEDINRGESGLGSHTMTCPFCDLVIPAEDWAVHTAACSGLTYYACCNCWGNGHTCPVVDLDEDFLCTSCWEVIKDKTAIFDHPCTKYCRYCGEDTSDGVWEHLCTKHYESRMAMEYHQEPEPMEEDEFDISARESMQGLLRETQFSPRGTYISALAYMDALRHPLYTATRNLENGSYLIRVEVMFERPLMNENMEVELSRWERFTRNARPSGELVDFDTWLREITSWLEKMIEEYTKLSSGWRVREIDTFTFSHSIFRRVDGGSSVLIVPKYFRGSSTRWIRVLQQEREERVRRLDGSIGLRQNNYCFMDAILMCLAYQDSDPEIRKKVKECRKSSYLRNMKLNERYHLNFEGMDQNGLFGTDKLRAFEERNDIIVRCYTHTTKNHVSGFGGPLYVNSKAREENTKVVHIMLVTDMDSENPQSLVGHYLPIIDFHAMSVHYYNKRLNYKAGGPVCELCLRRFPKRVKDEDFKAHLKQCNRVGGQFEEMSIDPVLRFRDHAKTTQPMNVLYADTESLIRPDRKGAIHECAFIGSYLCWHPSQRHREEKEVAIDEGPDCVEQFMKRLTRIVKSNIDLIDQTRQEMVLTADDEAEIEVTRACAYCRARGVKLHRDHDHLTGRFLQMLCFNCNIRRRQTRQSLYVILHNFKNYDAHQLILAGISRLSPKEWTIEPVYQSGDKLICLSLRYVAQPMKCVFPEELRRGERNYYRVIFRDSCQFLPKKLSDLADLLPTTPITSHVMQQAYQMDKGHFGKGTYPYTYFDSWERMDEDQLPPIENFYNDLEEKPCDSKDYEEAQSVWRATQCRNLRDYTKVYLRLDVALLADVVEAFRNQVHEMSQLEPLHYCGIPGLTFSFAFKHANLELQALQDPRMYTFFEEGIRGGMTVVNKHHSRAEDDSSEKTHLFDVDANALYTGALSSILPSHEFEWMNETELSEITDDFMKRWNPEGEIGMTVMVDLEYPSEVQDQTLDLPLAPTPAPPDPVDMPAYMHELWAETHTTIMRPGMKLLLTHKNKKRYIVHHLALKYYVERGLRITKVHQGVRYKQTAFFKSYADLHTLARSQATDDLTKMVRKLYTNALYGKTMENPRKYGKFKFVRDGKFFTKYTDHPLCKKWFKIEESAVVIELQNKKAILDKPIYIGQAVLDISKITMYRMFENWKNNPLIDSVELIGGDTDSFFLEVKSKYKRDEILAQFKNVRNELDPLAQGVLDTSNYPKDHPLYSNVNTSRLGCFKDEAKGKKIVEFICLCPKQYSFILEGGKHDNRAKGVKSYKRDTLTHEDYRLVYETHEFKAVTQQFLQSRHHLMRTIRQTRCALSPWEDKRAWDSPNRSYPYGYYKLYEWGLLQRPSIHATNRESDGGNADCDEA